MKKLVVTTVLAVGVLTEAAAAVAFNAPGMPETIACALIAGAISWLGYISRKKM
jgi:hypothetical protein